MTSSSQISDPRGINWNLYFQKAYSKSYIKYVHFTDFWQVFQSYGNVSAIWSLFGMGSF